MEKTNERKIILKIFILFTTVKKWNGKNAMIIGKIGIVKSFSYAISSELLLPLVIHVGHHTVHIDLIICICWYRHQTLPQRSLQIKIPPAFIINLFLESVLEQTFFYYLLYVFSELKYDLKIYTQVKYTT